MKACLEIAEMGVHNAVVSMRIWQKIIHNNWIKVSRSLVCESSSHELRTCSYDWTSSSLWNIYPLCKSLTMYRIQQILFSPITILH